MLVTTVTHLSSRSFHSLNLPCPSLAIHLVDRDFALTPQLSYTRFNLKKMHSLNILFTLSVALSGVQAHVARPRGQAHTLCYQDNQLRALERFSQYANEFCPAYLAGNTAEYPKWLNSWDKWKVSSACSCYEKTATSLGPSSSATLSLSALSSAPPALTAVFATTTASASSNVPFKPAPSPTKGYVPTGGYLPSGSIYGSGTGIPSVTAPLYTAPVISNPTSAVPNTVVPTSAVDTSAIDMYSSTASFPSEAATTAPNYPTPTANWDKYPPQPPGAGPGKRGLCYDYKTNPQWSELFVGSQFATYGSNWDVLRGDELDQSFSYVPTIAVDANLNNDNWNDTVPVLIEGGTKALFGSNEPDNAGQANLKVSAAVTVHMKYLQPYYGTVQLGTPAVTNGGGSTGLAYLEAFVEACTGCSFDFVNVHHYLQSSDVNTTQYIQALQDYIDIDVPAVQAKHPSIAGLPIFIGEVRPPPSYPQPILKTQTNKRSFQWWLWNASESEGEYLMDILLPYLDANPNVLGYQAFGGLWEGNFITPDGTGLTPAGQKYKTMAAAAPTATATAS